MRDADGSHDRRAEGFAGRLRCDSTWISRRNRSERRADAGVEHLQRDLSVVAYVVHEIDQRHFRMAELALDPVPVGERRNQPGGLIGQAMHQLKTLRE